VCNVYVCLHVRACVCVSVCVCVCVWSNLRGMLADWQVPCHTPDDTAVAAEPQRPNLRACFLGRPW